ncbi:alpha/beta hydrolase-fold protein [Nocardia sp. CDC159]|uniref:Alpha/beta hydrolase-fold protein n=1 Tax=Nocardia pulmonis TaxID=2951408 RepID=A0A9X2E3L0_9NOCA|nr:MULTISPECIES: PHB depolymerase family esterase [Nocardia]MCM6773269.1 alpha/beta hydrolase-fold protein [Nocardia pulmonis]MCM6786156.1 alpha/beta hydrolase-fold protein [Nocardia sp. CDC159]
MASSLTKRLAALLGASCAAFSLAISAAGPARADDEPFDNPDGVAAACSTAPTNGTKQIDNFDGRHYRIRVPAGIPASGAPLVVVIHGGYGSPQGIESQSGWNSIADQKKAIVVYPRGSKPENSGWGWDAGANAYDITHIKKVVADVRAKYCVNPKRIHLSGHSNGGQMASRVACTEPGIFASGAVYAPAPPPTGCDPSRAVSWAVFASADDRTVLEPIAYSHVMYWSWENRPCQNERPDGGTDVKDSKRWDCDAGTQVVWRVYNGGSHSWPTGPRRDEMLNRMWQLFQAYPRP